MRELTFTLASATLAVAFTLVSSSAEGETTEAIRLSYDAPPGCDGEAQFVERVAGLDGKLRAPVGEGNVRTFAVRIKASEGGAFAGQLQIIDVWDEEIVRDVTGERCEDVVKSLALFVALALEDPADPGLSREGRRIARAHRVNEATTAPFARVGSGGLAVSGHFDWNGSHFQKGLRALGAVRAFGTTRFGLVAAFTQDLGNGELRGAGTPEESRFQARGYSGRLGAIVGWGAPWNDGVVGFVGEVGAAAGYERGVLTHWVGGGTSPMSSTFVSPYAAASLVLQVPWRSPVRPFAGLTGIFLPWFHDGPNLLLGVDVGIAWQAW